MGAAFLITLREGMEAALILSIILAYLNRVERRDRHRAVWTGTGLALAASLVAGAVIFAISGELSHTAAEVFEGVASLLAVTVLTWMIFWMRRNAVNIKGELQEQVSSALATGSGFGLSLLAFFVVVREGLETALFLFSAFKAGAETSGALKLTGALLGLLVAVILGVLIYRGGVRINLRLFFRVTGVLILLVAASLLVYGIHELSEVGVFGTEGEGLLAKAGFLSPILGAILKVFVGLGRATWLEAIAFLTYAGVTGYLFFRPDRPKGPIPQPVAEGTGSAQDSPERASQSS